MPGLPAPTADERENLLAYLAQQRSVVRIAAFGLTDEQLRATPSVSALSVGAVLKHVAATERSWMDTILQRPPSSPVDYGATFTLAPDETLDDLLADYADVAAETEAIVASIDDLGRAVPVPKGVPWFPDHIEAWSVRWVLLHIIEETARHAGHADIVRESIDGATAYELMAAAEGWPATEWLTPWEPAPSAA